MQDTAGVCRDIPQLLADLKSCGLRRDLQWGTKIHAKAMASGVGSHLYVKTALIKMYAKCGSMVDAHLVFDTAQKPDVIFWSALLLGYAENGQGHLCLELFSKMKTSGCAPNSITYVAVLKACTSLFDVKLGLKTARDIHFEIGSHLNLYVQSALIDAYAKCGSMADARRVFDKMQNPDVVAWSALLLGYAENGEGHIALEMFSKMKAHGCTANSVTYIAVLKASMSLVESRGRALCLQIGRILHSEAGCQPDFYVQNTLIDMYARCGSMLEARQVFDSIRMPNVVSWSALLLGYAENGKGLVSLEMFSRMKTSGCAPDSVTYIAVIKACMSLATSEDSRGKEWALEVGRSIHVETSSNLNLYVQSTLIDMYAKLSSMAEARQVFDCIDKPNVVAWNALLIGYAENGDGHTALDLFSEMKIRGCAPDSITYVAVIKAFVVSADYEGKLELGRSIHLEIGCHLDLYLQTMLIDMYAKLGSMTDARQVFDSIGNPDVVSWTALILGYAENGKGYVALNLFSKMKAHGCAPKPITYVAVLKACASIGALALGREFHRDASEFTAHLVTCLVDFYAKCGSMLEAREVFELHSAQREISTWNALLAGYSTCGDAETVFNLFKAMQDEAFAPNAVTFLCMLLCCSHAGLVQKAKEYLEVMPAYGVTPTVMHYTCMVDALGRGNRLSEAIAVLQKMPCNADVVIWTTLLCACHKWKNAWVGTWAFESLTDMDVKNASAYVLMAQIYGSRGMWEEQERVLECSMKHAV